MTSTTDTTDTTNVSPVPAPAPFSLTNRPPNSYTLIPWAHNQQTIFYRQFGSYQGEWIIVAIDQSGQYIFWDGAYGSCSGCDALEGTFSYSESLTRESATKFAEDYKPFLEVPRDTMVNLVRGNNLASILPRNKGRGLSYSDVDYAELATTISVLVKLRESIDVTAQDIFSCTNAEIRRYGLEQYGLDKFLSEMSSTVLDTDKSGDSLIGIADRRFLLLADPSTNRRYLLGVPDDQTKVRDAKGWTFGLQPGSYDPVVET